MGIHPGLFAVRSCGDQEQCSSTTFGVAACKLFLYLSRDRRWWWWWWEVAANDDTSCVNIIKPMIKMATISILHIATAVSQEAFAPLPALLELLLHTISSLNFISFIILVMLVLWTEAHRPMRDSTLVSLNELNGPEKNILPISDVHSPYSWSIMSSIITYQEADHSW